MEIQGKELKKSSNRKKNKIGSKCSLLVREPKLPTLPENYRDNE